MNAIKVVVDNPVGEAIGFLASLIPVDELLAPLTALFEAMITDLFPGTKIVGTLAEYRGDVDQIKTKLDTMKEKLADFKTHYEALSPKKIAEQKMKYSKAAGSKL